jgi:hypothetical protein
MQSVFGSLEERKAEKERVKKENNKINTKTV